MNDNQMKQAENEYYLQRVPSNYLGNSPFWWAKGDKGYTAYILGAKRFTESEAKSYVDDDPKKWAMYKCAEVDKRLHLVFDHQDFSRLGTDEPCGWPSGYAKLTTSQVSEPDEDEIYAMIGKIGMSETRPIGQQWDSVITLVRHFAKTTTTPQEAISPAIAEYVKKLESALKFYADKTNYDCDHDIGMEVSHRVILYKDQYQHNDTTYYAGKRAIEALASKPTGLE